MWQFLLLLLSNIFSIINIIQQRCIRWQFLIPFPPRSHEHGGYLGYGASHQFLKTVSSRARKEHKQSYHNSTSAYTVPPFTPQVVLYVNQDCNCTQRPYAYQEEEPVKEIGHVSSLFGIRVIELVRTESGHAGFQTPGTQRNKVQCQV